MTAIWRCDSPRDPRMGRRFRTSATNSISSPRDRPYRVEDKVTDVGAGDVLFCAAHVAHGFENISEDFSVWVLFYGPVRQSP